MDWTRAVAIGGGYVVVPDSRERDDWWHLTKGTGNPKTRENFFFDASAFGAGTGARAAAAAAAADEHLCRPGPANREACRAREEYHRQRVNTARRVMAEAKGLGDRQRVANAKKAVGASIARLEQLEAISW